jgi:hypothetical protein
MFDGSGYGFLGSPVPTPERGWIRLYNHSAGVKSSGTRGRSRMRIEVIFIIFPRVNRPPSMVSFPGVNEASCLVASSPTVEACWGKVGLQSFAEISTCNFDISQSISHDKCNSLFYMMCPIC